MQTILEIIQSTVPALVVFFTVYVLMREFFSRQYQTRMLEFKQQQQNTTIPMRLQAYERLALFCERLYLPGLVMRVRNDEMDAGALRLALMITIRQEYEYNITQQVYISGQLWQIIKTARDNTLQLIDLVSENVDPGADSRELATALMQYAQHQEATGLDNALRGIREEASLLM